MTYTISTPPSSSSRWTYRVIIIPFSEADSSHGIELRLQEPRRLYHPKEHCPKSHATHKNSPRYIETDGIEFFTGEIGLVKNTSHDITSPKQIGADLLSSVNTRGFKCVAYDNAFIIDCPRYSGPELTDLTFTNSSPITGIQRDIKSNQQSNQTYTYSYMDSMIAM